MPDVGDLVLDDHEQLRRRFAELDEERAAAAPRRLGELWGRLAAQLELHAAAEEEVFYPALLRAGVRAEEETTDAISDHNDIRDAVGRAGEAAPGDPAWWAAVDAAREANSAHMAEEERGALADLRANAAEQVRQDLGSSWTDFVEAHAGMRGLEARDRDPAAYLAEHGDR